MSRRRTAPAAAPEMQVDKFLHILASVHRVRAWLATKPKPSLVRDVLVLEERNVRNTAVRALRAYLETDNGKGKI